MQDNKKNIDKIFVDHSWQSMSELLDIHMPQEKKRKIPIWLWFFGFLLLFFLGYMSMDNWYSGQNSETLLKPRPIQRAELLENEPKEIEKTDAFKISKPTASKKKENETKEEKITANYTSAETLILEKNLKSGINKEIINENKFPKTSISDGRLGKIDENFLTEKNTLDPIGINLTLDSTKNQPSLSNQILSKNTVNLFPFMDSKVEKQNQLGNRIELLTLSRLSAFPLQALSLDGKRYSMSLGNLDKIITIQKKENNNPFRVEQYVLGGVLGKKEKVFSGLGLRYMLNARKSDQKIGFGMHVGFTRINHSINSPNIDSDTFSKYNLDDISQSNDPDGSTVEDCDIVIGGPIDPGCSSPTTTDPPEQNIDDLIASIEELGLDHNIPIMKNGRFVDFGINTQYNLHKRVAFSIGAGLSYHINKSNNQEIEESLASILNFQGSASDFANDRMDYFTNAFLQVDINSRFSLLMEYRHGFKNHTKSVLIINIPNFQPQISQVRNSYGMLGLAYKL